MIDNAVREYKRLLAREHPGKISQDKGALKLSPDLLELAKTIGVFVKAIAATETLKLPTDTQQQAELAALLKVLHESLTRFDGNIRFVAPVCPDYSQESSDDFYQTIGEGVSPQAAAAIRAARTLIEIASAAGFTPHIDILVADTEDDLPEVMQRCVGGDTTEYKRRCLSSVEQISSLIAEPHSAVTTFTDGLGPEFRHTQYAYESVINTLRLSDENVAAEVQKIGERRVQRHSKILGREEQGFELTVRYMAQYAALGTLMRNLNEPVVLLNYPTPNLPFFNAAQHRMPQFSLSENDQAVVPVVTTVL